PSEQLAAIKKGTRRGARLDLCNRSLRTRRALEEGTRVWLSPTHSKEGNVNSQDTCTDRQWSERRRRERVSDMHFTRDQRHARRLQLALPAAGVGLTLLVAACGGSGGSSTGAAGTAPPASH